MFRLCALVGIEHSLCWGGWRQALIGVPKGKMWPEAARGRTQELRLGLAPRPDYAQGRGLPSFSLLVAVRSAEAWGSRAATAARAAALRSGGAGGSGARSGNASKRRTDRRGHPARVSALEFDIHLSRVYPPPFSETFFFLTVFFSVLIYFCFPFPTKSGRPFGRLLFPPKITSDSGNGQRKKVAQRLRKSEGRETGRRVTSDQGTKQSDEPVFWGDRQSAA